MSESEAAGTSEGPAPDDTGAFQRFYQGSRAGAPGSERGVLYRLLVGWWRKP